jgi:hypothetical protein
MKDGHPFETEDLDRLRARHRRWLRALPDDLVTGMNLQAPSVDEGDRGLIETGLRRSIDELGAPHVDYLDAAAASAANRLAMWCVNHSSGNGFANTGVETLVDRRGSHNEALPDAPNKETLAAVAVAAILADRCATDGYLDSRLAQP